MKAKFKYFLNIKNINFIMFIVLNGIISGMIFSTMKIKNKVVYTDENIQ